MKMRQPKRRGGPIKAVYLIEGEHVTVDDIAARTGKHDKFVRRKLQAARDGLIPTPLTWRSFA